MRELNRQKDDQPDDDRQAAFFAFMAAFAEAQREAHGDGEKPPEWGRLEWEPEADEDDERGE